MESYEIRILRMDGSPGLITQQKYLSANAAITAAKLLARGRRFEVWNEDYCVYDGMTCSEALTPSPYSAA